MSHILEAIAAWNPYIQVLSALGALGVAWRLLRCPFRYLGKAWKPRPDGESPDSRKRKDRDERLDFLAGRFKTAIAKVAAPKDGDVVKVPGLFMARNRFYPSWEAMRADMKPVPAPAPPAEPETGDIFGVALHGAAKGEVVELEMGKAVVPGWQRDAPPAEPPKTREELAAEWDAWDAPEPRPEPETVTQSCMDCGCDYLYRGIPRCWVCEERRIDRRSGLSLPRSASRTSSRSPGAPSVGGETRESAFPVYRNDRFCPHCGTSSGGPA